MTERRPTNADSTVGFTVYNVLTMNRGAMTVEQIHIVAMNQQHMDLELAQVQRGADKLVYLKRIKVEQGAYSLIATERFRVVRRDMSDYNVSNMEGGWEGWQVQVPGLRDGIGFRPLEELLGLPPTGRRPRSYTAAQLNEHAQMQKEASA